MAAASAGELGLAVLGIVLLDLVLSGDNALVIGLAARHLPPRQQRRAIMVGTAGAVGARVLATALVTVVLSIPLLQAIGGLLLLGIAVKLLRQPAAAPEVTSAANLLAAVRTIVVADAVMSLDNMLAVGGTAHGNIWLLLVGLGLSIPIVLVGSRLVAVIMTRLPWLVYAGAAVLVAAAADLLLADRLLRPYYPPTAWFQWGTIILLIAGILALAWWLDRRRATVGTGRPPGWPLDRWWRGDAGRRDGGSPEVPVP
jgi:YjbE family integral membrane protein